MTGGVLSGSRRTWLAVAAIGVAAGAAALAPPPAVIADAGGGTQAAFAALASAAIVALTVLPFTVWRGARRPQLCLAVAGAGLALGMGSFYAAGQAQRACTARYGDARVVIGGELTAEGSIYKQANPQLSNDDLLFDAAGVPERVWTPASMRRCRGLISATYFLWIPFLIVCLVTAAQALPNAFRPPLRWDGPLPSAPGASAARYDVFISYRHSDVDTSVARQLLAALEGDGYRVAIDERDFPANAGFLQEMERCIRESRFTVAVISSGYLESGNCEEEAVICRVLDLGDRKRRLIPFVIQTVAMPAWLYGIVGIDSTKPDPLVDPIEKLRTTLGAPMSTPRPA